MSAIIEACDIDIVGEGVQRLRDALTANRVTLARIEREYDSDRRLLEAREFWGDKDDDQRLITRGNSTEADCAARGDRRERHHPQRSREMRDATKFQTTPGIIRFFKLGDFYEAFDDDARTVGRELEITVTSTRGDSPRAMAGVPYHAIDRYIEQLRGQGYIVEVY